MQPSVAIAREHPPDDRAGGSRSPSPRDRSPVPKGPRPLNAAIHPITPPSNAATPPRAKHYSRIAAAHDHLVAKTSGGSLRRLARQSNRSLTAGRSRFEGGPGLEHG